MPLSLNRFGDQEHHGQNDQHDVVVRALAREGQREELARHERQVGPVGRGPTQNPETEEVLLRRQGEHEGDDGEVEPFDPQRAEPEDHGEDSRAGRGGDDGEPEGHASFDQAGGKERAEAGEGHLAERQLAQPAGEDGQRGGADGESQNLGEGLLGRGLGEDQREDDGDRSEEENPALVDVASPAEGLQPHGDRAGPGSEREDLALVGALPVEEDRHDHDDQEQQD